MLTFFDPAVPAAQAELAQDASQAQRIHIAAGRFLGELPKHKHQAQDPKHRQPHEDRTHAVTIANKRGLLFF